MRIISWVLEIHCNPRVLLGWNQLVEKCSMETDESVTEDICNLI